MDKILKLSDLYSEDVQEVKRATEAIKERMDYRCARPDSQVQIQKRGSVKAIEAFCVKSRYPVFLT